MWRKRPRFREKRGGTGRRPPPPSPAVIQRRGTSCPNLSLAISPILQLRAGAGFDPSRCSSPSPRALWCPPAIASPSSRELVRSGAELPSPRADAPSPLIACLFLFPTVQTQSSMSSRPRSFRRTRRTCQVRSTGGACLAQSGPCPCPPPQSTPTPPFAPRSSTNLGAWPAEPTDTLPFLCCSSVLRADLFLRTRSCWTSSTTGTPSTMVSRAWSSSIRPLSGR